ncbi:MAG: ABC transporter ATP-binding protein [Bdellovibrionota bacterium]
MSAIEFRAICKRFGAVLANDGVDLQVRSGTIHGLIGENGAGKSTAVKILYGMQTADSGEFFLDGTPCAFDSPLEAIARGVGMVHQHFMLSGPNTALENIVLGASKAGKWWLTLAEARRQLTELGRRYGLEVPLDEKVERLPVGIQQRVEILKLLYRDAKVLILDEPTAVLTPQETDALFVQLRKLRDEGKTILIITHKLREVLALTDEITVFRAGKTVAVRATSKTNAGELAELMVGRRVTLNAERAAARWVVSSVTEAERERPVCLELEKVSAPEGLTDINLRVHAGEIVGIAGVDGNGQNELFQAILHPHSKKYRSTGTIRLQGRDVSAFSAREIRHAGVGVIPGDRHRDGVLLNRSLVENFWLGQESSAAFRRKGIWSWLTDRANLAREAGRALADYDVRPREDLTLAVGGLSGGNQQKLVVAREFFAGAQASQGGATPALLLASQPTRGVDVGAIELIHSHLVRARNAGGGVLLVSSELDEILALADRVLVLYQGQFVAEFLPGQAGERELGLAMAGVRA